PAPLGDIEGCQPLSMRAAEQILGRAGEGRLGDPLQWEGHGGGQTQRWPKRALRRRAIRTHRHEVRTASSSASTATTFSSSPSSPLSTVKSALKMAITGRSIGRPWYRTSAA